MTTYNTGNPIGSKDPRDLYDNAENLDTAVNDIANDTWQDRLGRSRKTMSGMERQFDAAEDYREATFISTQADKQNRFNDFIAASGYQFLGDYAAGIEITEYNQIVRDADGEFWRLSGQVELPYTTTGAGLPEGDALTPLGDAVLRQELDGSVQDGQGGAMVRGAVIYVNTIADLQALDTSGLVEGQVVNVGGYGYTYQGENQGFLAPSTVDAAIYGVHPDVGDVSDALQAAIDDVAESGGGTVFIREPGDYILTPNSSEVEGLPGAPVIYAGVFLRSGVSIKLGVGVTLKRDALFTPTTGADNALLVANSVQDIDISGGAIAGEFSVTGFANSIYGIKVTGISSRITVRDMEIYDCKDGIFFGMHRAGIDVRDCVVERVVSHDNGRLGLTVTDFVSRLRISDCTFYGHTHNMPQAGIDIEPGYGHDENLARDIEISGCHFYGNRYQDLVFSKVIGLKVSGCTFGNTDGVNNTTGQAITFAPLSPPAKNVLIDGCTIYNESGIGVNGANVTITNVVHDRTDLVNSSPNSFSLQVFGDGDLRVKSCDFLGSSIAVLINASAATGQIELDGCKIMRPKGEAFRIGQAERFTFKNGLVVFNQKTGHVYTSLGTNANKSHRFIDSTFILEEGASGHIGTLRTKNVFKNCSFIYEGLSEPTASAFIQGVTGQAGMIDGCSFDSTSATHNVLYNFYANDGVVKNCDALYRTGAFPGTNIFNCIDAGDLE